MLKMLQKFINSPEGKKVFKKVKDKNTAAKTETPTVKKNNTKITLINEGLSLRDFIHLDDVGKIYSIFASKKLIKGIYDIGTGKGYLIKDLVNLTKISIKKLIKILLWVKYQQQNKQYVS